MNVVDVKESIDVILMNYSKDVVEFWGSNELKFMLRLYSMLNIAARIHFLEDLTVLHLSSLVENRIHVKHI